MRTRVTRSSHIRTTRQMSSSSFTKPLKVGELVEALEHHVTTGDVLVTKIRTEDGTTGWTDAANLDLHRPGN